MLPSIGLSRQRRDRYQSAATRSKRARRVLFQALESRLAMDAGLATILTEDHIDLLASYQTSSGWSLQVDADGTGPQATGDTLLYVGSNSLVNRPTSANWDFVGVSAGSEFYLAPQSEDSGKLYLGANSSGVLPAALNTTNPSIESKGRASGNAKWVKFALVGVEHTNVDGSVGEGVFSVWSTGSFGESIVFVSSYDDGIVNPNSAGLDTTDGVSADDAWWLVAGSHAHYNFGFSQPGRYEVQLQLSADLSGSGVLLSDPITVYFSVESIGQLEFEQSSYSVDEAAGTLSIDVVRTGGSDGRISVAYNSLNGSAVSGEDYTAVSGMLEFLDGETRKSIVIPILDDSAIESNETFSILLASPLPANFDAHLQQFENDVNGLLGTLAVTIVTLGDNDGNSAPVALEDRYTVAPGNILRGNVLLNDIDGDGDTLATVLVSTTTKGTLVLNSNGTFDYSPNSTFNGSDSFTYRADDGDLESALTTVTIDLPGDQRFDAGLTDDHVDIGIAYEGGQWDLHVHDEHSDQEFDSYKALLHVGAAAITTRTGDAANPSFDFLGVTAGQLFYLLPQSQNPELVYLGVAAEEMANGTFVDDQVSLHLKSVNGPGHFSIWESTGSGPSLLMATSDGITPEDRLLIGTGTHAHFNYAFSARGSYDVTFEAVATLPDGTVTTSGNVTYRFLVNSAATAIDDTYDVTEDMVLTIGAASGLLINDTDPDGDSLRAALVQAPANGRVTVNPDGSFVYVPNANFYGTDTFTYTTTDVRYRIVPLGTLGGNSSFALDVNNERQVSGNSNNSAVSGNPLQAYRWENGQFTPIGVLAGTGTNNFSRGYAVNDDGLVVGESDNNISLAFVYEAGTISGLTRLAGDNFRGVAHDINNNDIIVGISSNGTVSRPTIWTFDGVNYIASDLGTISGTDTSTGRAWAINDDGLVVGLSHNASGVSQATLWNGGTITNLTSLGDGTRFSQAFGLNVGGLIVGSSSTGQTVGQLIGSTSTTGITRAFAWENGEIVELLPHNFFAPGNTGTTTNYHSVATDVNDTGLIVGNSQRISGLAAIATLWVDGAAMDLNALVANGSGWTLRSAEGINGGGDIVGFGTFSGFSRAFMLVPEVVSIDGKPFSNTATVTINVAGTPDAPEAADDFYEALSGNIVHGNVLLNDFEPDGDSMTVTIASGPAHGTVSLNTNGSFVYTPGATFENSDSFTYSVSDGLGGTDSATVTITAASLPSFEARLRTGHADIGIAFGAHDDDDGHGHSHGSAEPEWDLHIHVHNPDTEYGPDEALFYVGRDAMLTRSGAAADPAYDFLGVPVGGSLFVLPEVENPNLLFLGIGGEELGEGLLVGDVATLQLVAVSGPGHFSIWQSGLTPSTPNLFMATADGIDASDTFDVVAGSHAHVNFGFSEQGYYEVTFIASGIDAEGHATDSGPVTYYFYVTDGLVPFSRPNVLSPGLSVSGFNSELADFNGDGNLDLIVAGSGANALGYRQGVGDGSFLEEQSLNAGTGLSVDAIVAVDYDLDGDIDLVALEYVQSVADTGAITLYRNDGSATFTRIVLRSDLPVSYQVGAGDLNGDGRPDVVFGKTETTVAYALQQSDGALGTEVLLPATLSSMAGVLLGDMNNDGDLDIVVGNRANGVNAYFSVFSNDGNGVFSAPQNKTTGNFPVVHQLVDMNGDGRLDVVTGESVVGSRAGYYPQLADGTFGSRVVVLPTNTQLNSIRVADINGDGVPDIVAGAIVSNFSLLWSPGLGGGAFGNTIRIDPSHGNMWSLQIGDLDGDGYPDLITTGTASALLPSAVKVYINKTVENPMVLQTPAARTRVAGDPIDVDIYFGFPITVTGSPRVAIQVGAETRHATYLSGSGNPTLKFRYLVTDSDIDLDGAQLASNVIDLNGGTLADPLGGAAILEFPNEMFTGVIVNGAGPLVSRITRVDDRSTDAATVRFQVQFNGDVTDVDASDFNVLMNAGDLSGASILSVTGSGSLYEVTVSTGTGAGTLGLSVKGDASIFEPGGVILARGFAGGEVYTVRKAPLGEIDIYYTNGHADYRPVFDNGEFSYIVDADPGVLPARIYPSDSVYTYADSNAIVARSSNANFNFTGVGAGQPLYVLPSTNNPTLPYLGLSGESLVAGTFAAYRPDDPRFSPTSTIREYVKVQMVDMRSSSGGEFSLYSGTAPTVWMATSDGISETDSFWLYRTHFHRNLAFSKPGIYEIDVVISGYLDSNGNGIKDPTDVYVESGIKTMVFNVDTLGARDDAFTISGQDRLVSSVVMNDEWADGFGVFTASVDTTTTKGTLSLHPSGSFTYTPNASFAGTDSFTYRLTNPRGGFTTAVATISMDTNKALIAGFNQGHGDLGIAFESGAFDLHLHIEGGEHDHEESGDDDDDHGHGGLEYALNELQIQLDSTSATVVPSDPAFGFLGLPGDNVFVLPAVNNPELPFLGIATEEIAAGTFLDGRVLLKLKSVSGPGNYSLWSVDSFGAPTAHMTTSDGLTNDDMLELTEGAHAHFNMGFSQAGFYAVTFEAAAVLADGATAVSSGDVTYYFAVASGVAPVVTLASTPQTYTEQAPARVIDSSATVTDGDSIHFDGGFLRVDFAAGGQPEDQLSIQNQGVGVNQISVSGDQVAIGVPGGSTLVIGTFAGGSAGEPLVVMFNENAAPAHVSRLMRSITFRNLSDNPTAERRLVRFAIQDGTELLSDAALREIEVTPINDAPVLITSPGATSYEDNEPAKIIDSQLLVLDSDSENFDAGTLTIAIVENEQSSDRLSIIPQGDGPGEINVAGDQVLFAGIAIGSFTGGFSTSEPLVVSLNENATVAAVQQLARRVAFSNVSATPADLARVIQFVVTDGDGGTSYGANKDVIMVGNTDISLSVAPMNAVQSEGNGGTKAFTFVVTRSGYTGVATTVDYQVAGDVDAADFGGVLPGGTVTFPVGATSQVITLFVSGDEQAEFDEAFTVTLGNASGTAVIDVALADGVIVNDDAAQVASVVVANPTSTQRSFVERLVVTFEGRIGFDAGAFNVEQLGSSGGDVTVVASDPQFANGQTTVVLTFAGAFTRGNFNALVDGNYRLIIDASKVHSGTVELDGDSDGTAGGSFVFGEEETDNFFAFYGDLDGNRRVELAEFNAFRGTFGKSSGDPGYNPWLDYQGVGIIGLADFNQFRNRFGRRLNY